MTTRTAPPLTSRTQEYWRSGADGQLRLARCSTCGFFMHPPRPLCSACHCRDVRFEPVSGHGVVYSFTINRYQWDAGLVPPYIIAEVELAEQPGLRLLTALVGMDITDAAIGMPVKVQFEQAGDTWIPVFAR